MSEGRNPILIQSVFVSRDAAGHPVNEPRNARGFTASGSLTIPAWTQHQLLSSRHETVCQPSLLSLDRDADDLGG
jgi:hypothetical protein